MPNACSSNLLRPRSELRVKRLNRCSPRRAPLQRDARVLPNSKSVLSVQSVIGLKSASHTGRPTKFATVRVIRVYFVVVL